MGIPAVGNSNPCQRVIMIDIDHLHHDVDCLSHAWDRGSDVPFSRASYVFSSCSLC